MNKKPFSKIRELFGKLFGTFEQNDIPIRTRMFLVISSLGTIISAICLVETIIVREPWSMVAILGVLFLLLLSGTVIGLKGKNIDVSAILMSVFLNIAVFPALFILGGGIESGAVIWFLLGYFYIFLLFTGYKMFILIGFSILCDFAIYIGTTLHPEIVQPAASERAAYADSLFSVIAVGVTVGILIHVETRFYENANKVARQQKEELEINNQARTRLFAGMSHEIRTPINSVLGLDELILRENPSEEVAAYANEIQTSSRLLLSLVNDIMDLSRLELKQLEITPQQYSTKEMFRNLYELVQVHARKKGLEFNMVVDPQIPSILLGDEKRVEQIYLNLLTNSVKYTEKGSVSFSATCEKNEDGSCFIVVEVEDTGIGIHKENLEHIYESFNRLEMEHNSEIEGSGLGLSIVKQLVDLMEGKISVDSIYTKGSTFTVRIPQTVVDHAPIGNISFGEKNTERLYRYHQKFEAPDARILIVDDNHMNTVVTSRLLAATRMQIYSAKSAKECLAMTKNKFFHVILMDYRMPEMDGRQAVQELRKQENGLCKETPVIALTASSKAEAKELVSGEEFVTCLEKPIRSDLLEEEILNLLPSELVEYREETVNTEVASDNRLSKIRRRAKVKITTDCVCDLPRELLEKYNIGQQYLYIKTGHGRFKDTIEIDSDNLSQYLKDEEEKPKAISCSTEEFEEFFAEQLTEAVDIIHISMAEKSGKTFSVASEAARGFDHVHIVDSGFVSCGQGLLVIEAARLAKTGKTVEEIISLVEDLKNSVNCGFLSPDADTFSYFGYTTKFKADFVRTFKLHPILKIQKSRIAVGGFMTGEDESAWRKYVSRRLRKSSRVNESIAVVTFANCTTRQKEIVMEEIGEHVNFETILVTKSSFSNAASGGTGTFGLAFYEKE